MIDLSVDKSMPRKRAKEKVEGKKSRRPVMKTLKLTISRDNLIASGGLEDFLRAITAIKPNAEVISIDLEIPDLIPVTIKLKEEGGGKVTHLS